MATTATPTGAEPVNTLSASGSYSGKVRHMKIANNYGTALFYGDFVKPVTAGVVEKDAGTATLTPIGIFVGCSYTDPTTKQLTFSQFYPASTAADDISAYVVDDPDVVEGAAHLTKEHVQRLESRLLPSQARSGLPSAPRGLRRG